MGKSNVSRTCRLFTFILPLSKVCKIRILFTLIGIFESTGTSQTEIRCKVKYAMLECGAESGEKTKRNWLALLMISSSGLGPVVQTKKYTRIW